MSTRAARDRVAERGVAVAVPADRGVRVPVGLPHRRAGGAGRCGRLAVRSSLRLGERVRQPARSGGGHVPVRAVRHQRADLAGLRARHQRGGDDVEDAVGLGRGARCADDGPIAGDRHRDAAHAAAGRRRRRAHPRAGGRVPRRSRRDGGGVRAGVRLRAGAGHVADRGRGRPCRRCAGRRRRAPAADRSVGRRRGRPGEGSSRAPCRATGCTARCRGRRASRRRPMSTTPRSGSPPRWRSGGVGWTGRESRITGTGSRSSAPRSPSRV